MLTLSHMDITEDTTDLTTMVTTTARDKLGTSPLLLDQTLMLTLSHMVGDMEDTTDLTTMVTTTARDKLRMSPLLPDQTLMLRLSHITGTGVATDTIVRTMLDTTGENKFPSVMFK